MNFLNQILQILKKKSFFFSFKDNICSVDLADMQSLSKYNKGIKYLLCAIDLLSKYAWVIPLKDKKGTSVVKAFQKKKKLSTERKPMKLWVDQRIEFYNQPFKDFLKIKNIEMYSIFNEGKSVIAERFFGTLKNKIFKHMTAISKNVYVDMLDNIVDKYNNSSYNNENKTY